MTLNEVAERLGVETTHPDDCWCPSCWDGGVRSRTERHHLDIAMNVLHKAVLGGADFLEFSTMRGIPEWRWRMGDDEECEGCGTFEQAVLALASRFLTEGSTTT